MDRLYKRVSLINLAVGSLLFLLLTQNLPFLFSIVPKEYSAGITVLYIFSINRVFEMFTGLNGYILLTSKKYYYDIIITCVLVVLAICTNWFLIPIYGMNGAAFATLISISFYNITRLYFIWYFYKLHPLFT